MDTFSMLPLAQQGADVVIIGGGLMIASLIVFVVWLVGLIVMLLLVLMFRKGFGLASGVCFGVAAIIALAGFACLLSAFGNNGGVSHWWLPREGLAARWFETCVVGNAVLLGSLAPAALGCIVTAYLGWPQRRK